MQIFNVKGKHRFCISDASIAVIIFISGGKCSQNYYLYLTYYYWSWGSLISIVSDYRLDDWGSIPGRGKDFPLPCVQTSSEAHPTSYPMGTGSPFPGGKARPGRDADHSPPFSVQVKNEWDPHFLFPLLSAWL
jgi:hypothetical protein